MDNNKVQIPFLTKYDNWTQQEDRLRKSIEDIIKEHIPTGSMHEFKYKPQAFVLERAKGGWGQTDAIFIDFLVGIEHRVLEADGEGELVYHTITGGENGDKCEYYGTDFQPCQLMAFLKQVEVEEYEYKLAKIKYMLRNHGGRLYSDGSFFFHATVDKTGEDKDYVCGEPSFITCFVLNDDDTFSMECAFCGEECVERDCQIPIDEIDYVLECAIKSAQTSIAIDKDQEKAIEYFKNAYHNLLRMCVGVVHNTDIHCLDFFNARNNTGVSTIQKGMPNPTIYVNVQDQLDELHKKGYTIGLGSWTRRTNDQDMCVKPIERN